MCGVMQVQQYVLYESASGYALFEVVEAEEIGALLPQVGTSWWHRRDGG